MSKRKLLPTLAALIITSTAQAEVLTFDGLAGSFMPNRSGKNFFATWFNDGRVANVKDYAIHSFGDGIPDGLISNDLLFISLQKAHSGPADWSDNPWNGTDYAIFIPELIIERKDETAFNLHSFDAQPWTQGDGLLNATVTGKFEDGSTITQIINLDTTPNENMLTGNDFTNYTFTGFDNIMSLSIAFTGRTHLAIDNINLTQYIAPVPEPENYAMLLAGLGLLAFSNATKRRS